MGERAYRAYEEAEREAFRSLPRATRIKKTIVAVIGVASVAAIVLFLSFGWALAETVDVKYRGPVDLAAFECTGELDSSVVKRVCYSAAHSYMLIRLKNTWYHYCAIDQGTVNALLGASSKGSFYNDHVKDAATGGKFGCRDKPIPQL